MGGVGLRSVARTCVPAFWASWADSLAMIRERHPGVANMIVDVLATGPVTPTLNALAQSDFAVRGVQGFDPPSWQALSHGARPPQREPDVNQASLGAVGNMRRLRGLSNVSAKRKFFPASLLNEKAMLRSQSGPRAGVALSAVPSCDALASLPICWCCSVVFAFPHLQFLALPMWPST